MNTKNLKDTLNSLKDAVTKPEKLIADLSDQVTKYETEGLDRFRTAVDESGKLMKSACEYQAHVSAECRKLFVESTKRAAKIVRKPETKSTAPSA